MVRAVVRETVNCSLFVRGTGHCTPCLFVSDLVAAWGVGMGLTVGSARNAQLLLRGCSNVSGQAAREHREGEHQQESFRRHQAFSYVWDVGPRLRGSVEQCRVECQEMILLWET